MHERSSDVDRHVTDPTLRRAIQLATWTVGGSSGSPSLDAFSALGDFLMADGADLDLIALRNTALLVIDGLGADYRIGCEAFVATVRYRLLFRAGEPKDASRKLIVEVDRRYGRLLEFAAELADLKRSRAST